MSGVIYMRVLRSTATNEYLRTLLYVFKNQMMLGRQSLHLTVKYRDGERESIKGNIDTVFKSPERQSQILISLFRFAERR